MSQDDAKDLLSAVNRGDLDEVRALPQRNGALVFTKGYEGETALHLAARLGR